MPSSENSRRRVTTKAQGKLGRPKPKTLVLLTAAQRNQAQIRLEVSNFGLRHLHHRNRHVLVVRCRNGACVTHRRYHLQDQRRAVAIPVLTPDGG